MSSHTLSSSELLMERKLRDQHGERQGTALARQRRIVLRVGTGDCRVKYLPMTAMKTRLFWAIRMILIDGRYRHIRTIPTEGFLDLVAA